MFLAESRACKKEALLWISCKLCKCTCLPFSASKGFCNTVMIHIELIGSFRFTYHIWYKLIYVYIVILSSESMKFSTERLLITACPIQTLSITNPICYVGQVSTWYGYMSIRFGHVVPVHHQVSWSIMIMWYRYHVHPLSFMYCILPWYILMNSIYNSYILILKHSEIVRYHSLASLATGQRFMPGSIQKAAKFLVGSLTEAISSIWPCLEMRDSIMLLFSHKFTFSPRHWHAHMIQHDPTWSNMIQQCVLSREAKRYER